MNLPSSNVREVDLRLTTAEPHQQSGHPGVSDAVRLANVGDYHGAKAASAYMEGDLDLYGSHIMIADRCWFAASFFSVNR